MKNRELREKLEKLPDDLEVWSLLADPYIKVVHVKRYYDRGEWKTAIMLE